MRKLEKHELEQVSGGADTGAKDLPDIPQTRTSGTTPDRGSLQRKS